MALSDVTVTFDLADILGTDFDARRTKIRVYTNVENQTLMDTSTGETRIGDARVTLATDGTGSFTTWAPGADGNPISWQTYIAVDYPRTGARDRVTRTFGPYTITANADLTELEEEQAVPAEYLTTVTAALDALVDEAETTLDGYVTDAETAKTGAEDARDLAEQYRDEAHDISMIDTSDGVVEALIQDAGSDTSTALSASLGEQADTDGTPLRDVLDAEFTPVAKDVRHPLTGKVHVDGYGAVGDGVTSDDAAFAAALLDAAGYTLYCRPGTYLLSGATRLALTVTKSSIEGDATGLATTLKFTHASGGLDIGDGTNITYENRLVNIVIIGTTSTTTTLIRCRKMYEPHWSNVRVEQANGTLVELNDCGKFEADRLYVQQAPIGLKFTGSTVSCIALINNGDFYQLDEVFRVATTSLGRLSVSNVWIETCPDVITLNNPGAAISIGDILFDKVRVVKASGNQQLLRAVDATSINAQVMDFDKCYVNASASTAPLIDFTALNNTGTVRASLRRTTTLLNASLTHLVKVHTSQSFSLFYCEVQDINGVDSAKWVEKWSIAGGVRVRPFEMYGYGTPEAVVTAPIGSTFKRVDGSNRTAMYTKVSGTGNTGWRESVGQLHVTAVINPGSIAAGATYTSSAITLTGATGSDAIALGRPGIVDPWPDGIIAQAVVTASDAVRIKLTNVTASPITPASATYTIKIIR